MRGGWGWRERDTHTGKNERQKEKRETDREKRERKIVREKSDRKKVREGEKNMLGTYYATKCKTLHGMKHHDIAFYPIKPYQPFNQTRTSTRRNQTTFSPSLYIYSHISHSSQSYGQQ